MRALAGVLVAGLWVSVWADAGRELLSGRVAVKGGESQSFSLHGESRQQVVGGTIRLGDQRFEIEKVSVHALIGAHRPLADGHEYVVFSSSYSEQTATGEPWVKAQHKHHCAQPYNSFLVIYSVHSPSKQAQLAATPYGELVESLQKSDESVLYCFMAKPPEKFTNT